MLEKDIQNNLINNLQSFGWTFSPEIKNINTIIKNFKKIINIRNKKELNDKGVTELNDAEFERLYESINRGFSFSDYQETFLDDKHIIKLDNGKDVYLDIFSKTKDTNIYQVAEEVIFSDDDKRMDVLLLINGLPLINIELKQEHVELGNAINQLEQYSKRYTSIFKFIQILVASNNVNTKYFANNEKINRKFIFNYSNSENKIIMELTSFAREFLEINNITEYLKSFIINKRETKTLIALRGYQVHGVKSIINRLKEPRGNGYLWHATGSGKTITSFKTAQVVSKELPEYKKVVFLVDRKELDQQTINEYNLFLPSYEHLPDTTTTFKLAKVISNSGEKLIVSTIQKMDKFLKDTKSKYKKTIDEIRNEKIVFIFDEGHRSQAGDMNQRIRKTFLNSRFIGFTGTPIFEDECNNSLQLTTNDIFHKNLHAYLIQNAIEDKNILPFNVVYKNEDIKAPVGQFLSGSQTITDIVADILDKFDLRTNKKKYSSMLVAYDINSAMMFYEAFKVQQKNMKEQNASYKEINVAITFTIDDGYDDEKVKRKEFMEQAISDFNTITNSRESATNQSAIQRYQSRLQSLLREEDGMPQINLVIVVDRLLTGFDAKRLNTLYVAKELKQHGLIQAFSRTNRVFDNEKVHGNIISYVPGMKSLVDKAITTYANQENSSLIFRKSVKEYIKTAQELIAMIEQINPNDIIVDPISKVDEGKEYILNVSKLNEVIKILNTMDGFRESDVSDDFTISKLEKLINISHQIKSVSATQVEKENILNPYDEISIPIRIVDIDKINSQYIKEKLYSALSEQRKGSDENMNKQLDDLIEQLESTNHVLFDRVVKLKEELVKNPNLDYIDFFEKQITEIETQLKVNYEISKIEIEKQLDDFGFYSSYRHMADEFKPKIKRLEKIKELTFAERKTKVDEIIIDIKNQIDSIRYSKEIIED